MQMQLNKYDPLYLYHRIDACSSIHEAYKLVYQWVKQDHITHREMGDLVIYAHDYFQHGMK